MLCCLTLMSWYRKEYETRFDTIPVEGLFFVDGNISERVNKCESECVKGLQQLR